MGVGVVTDREADGRPRLDATAGEALCLLQSSVGLSFDDAPLQHPGTLYVTTKRLIWTSDMDMGGYAVDFLSLSMHAISRDLGAYPAPCIYTQIEGNYDDEYGDEDEDDDNDEDEVMESEGSNKTEAIDLSKIREMRLVPSDASVLDNLFKILCDCAALNPDPEGELDGEGEFFFNKDEVLASSIGQPKGGKDHNLVDMAELCIHGEQFDDADDSGDNA